jgi:D-hexose-6-phosphate mutarotase
MFRTQVGHQTTIGKKTCVDKSKSRFSLVIFASIGSSGFEFTSLLHTYYSVEIAKMKIQGLQGCTFIDKVNGGERNEEKEFLQISSNVDRYVRVSNSEMNRALFPQHSSCLQCLQRNTRRTFLVHWQSQHQNRQREFP